MGAVVLSFAAGALSVLSPCVLPLLPIVVASALQHHRHGPLALAAGLVLTSAAPASSSPRLASPSASTAPRRAGRRPR